MAVSRTDQDWADGVHHFWFEALRPAQWFKVDPGLDQTIRERFGEIHRHVLAERASPNTPLEALSGVIVLDQFSRNIFRGSPDAFASDPLALARAEAAIAAGLDASLRNAERQFLYMPFMHSEDPAIQDRSIALFAQLNRPRELEFAKRHKAIIDRFGRFPHRNSILGRTSTPEEVAFVAQGGSF